MIVHASQMMQLKYARCHPSQGTDNDVHTTQSHKVVESKETDDIIESRSQVCERQIQEEGSVVLTW